LDFIREKVKKERITVFFTTHVMSEAEYLCDKIAIIDNGIILACGSADELKKKFGVETVLELTLQEKDENIINLLKSVPEVAKVTPTIDGKSITISVENPYSHTPKILKVLLEEGIHVAELRVREPTLEDVFIQAVQGRESE
jgi:ABC-2 type transport system ATP-binding protein